MIVIYLLIYFSHTREESIWKSRTRPHAYGPDHLNISSKYLWIWSDRTPMVLTITSNFWLKNTEPCFEGLMNNKQKFMIWKSVRLEQKDFVNCVLWIEFVFQFRVLYFLNLTRILFFLQVFNLRFIISLFLIYICLFPPPFDHKKKKRYGVNVKKTMPHPTKQISNFEI